MVEFTLAKRVFRGTFAFSSKFSAFLMLLHQGETKQFSKNENSSSNKVTLSRCRNSRCALNYISLLLTVSLKKSFVKKSLQKDVNLIQLSTNLLDSATSFDEQFWLLMEIL